MPAPFNFITIIWGGASPLLTPFPENNYENLTFLNCLMFKFAPL